MVLGRSMGVGEEMPRRRARAGMVVNAVSFSSMFNDASC